MSCQCDGIAQMFDDRVARRELRRFRRRGARKTTRQLLDLVRAEGVAGRSVLDIGGGIGAIHHLLLADGAASAVHVDASPAYLDVAREEAARRGTLERVTFVAGDFTRVADRVAEADIVTLDRVICCYDDLPTLVRASAQRARHTYGLVYPRDERWLVRALAPIGNWFLRLRGSCFRVFVHPTVAVERELAALGFRRRGRRTTAGWQAVVWAREAATGATA
jgi:SAM-dependent methyltransferase